MTTRSNYLTVRPRWDSLFLHDRSPLGQQIRIHLLKIRQDGQT
jgi:hypothetical protein